MRYVIAIALVLGACRSGPTTVHYAGPPIAQCEAGRPYLAPPENAPTTPFVPLTPAADAKPSAAPGAEHEIAEPPAADEPVADKPAKAKKSKKSKKQKKASEP